MKTIILFFLSPLICNLLSAQPTIEWQKPYGSTGNDKFHDIVQTHDGNYVAMGIADSMNGDVGCNIKGKHDEWIIKISPSGNILWQTCLGGTQEEEQPHNRLIATSDGGFLTAGETWSYDYNSVGNHGLCDVLLVKLNSAGSVQWTRVLGGSGYDTPRYLAELPGKNYLVLARTTSSNGDVPANELGGYNMVVFKINNEGQTVNTNVYGGSGNDELWAVAPYKGKLVFAGHTNSPELGASDTSAWLMISDLDGNILNSWVYGGDMDQKFLDLIPIADSEFIACGEAGVPADFWAVKLNMQGSLLWQKQYGGPELETFKRATKIKNGIYLAGGTTEENGKLDCYIVDIDYSGKKLWDFSLGGSGMDWANEITQNGYLCGFTNSNDGDVSGNHGGLCDGWIVKIIPPPNSTGLTTEERVETLDSDNWDEYIYPNPFSVSANINLHISTTSMVSIELYDLSGKQVAKIFEGALSPGMHELPVLRNDLPPALYLLRFKTNDEVSIKKIIVE